MKTPTLPRPLAFAFFASIGALLPAAQAAEFAANWLGHDRNRPQPPVVDPGYPSTPERAGKAPSDAVVLFDGADLSRWAAMDGQPSKWIVRDAAMECVPGSGYIRTLQSFGECQLHLEFATPATVKGNSQGRGNSGVFFGMGRYEIQVLDSYQNKTYADGSCGSVYNQYPPLVNASRKPGEWQTYDILWTPPKFGAEGKLLSPARVTVFHNGVVVQNNVTLIGETSWLQRPPYRQHPEKLPLALQDHGNPVRYRNVWVRELDGGKPEFYLPDATLESYTGQYENCEVSRKESNLILKFSGVETVLFAESPTHFFSKDVDIQAEFDPADKTVQVSVGEDGGKKQKRK
ncbi:hypothetical protein DB347_04640 [Opitutaceae bacterium EW11]|nr:hypothetical protein DB347_04640 [Opitutaceae bacterium EW11]